MEKAPFKLNKEMVDVARIQGNFVSMLLELMTHKSNFPAFKYNPHAVRDFRARLFLSKPESSIDKKVEKLIQFNEHPLEQRRQDSNESKSKTPGDYHQGMGLGQGERPT
eukprot:gene30294-39515_t